MMQKLEGLTTLRWKIVSHVLNLSPDGKELQNPVFALG